MVPHKVSDLNATNIIGQTGSVWLQWKSPKLGRNLTYGVLQSCDNEKTKVCSLCPFVFFILDALVNTIYVWIGLLFNTGYYSSTRFILSHTYPSSSYSFMLYHHHLMNAHGNYAPNSFPISNFIIYGIR